jgi:hypothetical protein
MERQYKNNMSLPEGGGKGEKKGENIKLKF